MENNWLDLIMKRKSVRTFDPSSYKETQGETVLEFVKKQESLFGSSFHFQAINGSEAGGKVGTYGIIKDPAFYLVGEADAGGYHPADYGYIGEKAVILGMSLGLGSCWLGGTFSRSSIAKAAGLSDGREIPSLLAFGVPRKRTHFADKATRFIAGSNKRNHPNLLFFTPEGEPVPLSENDPVTSLLETILIAPSASNKQPWRIVYEKGLFHFYLQRNSNYTRMLKAGGLPDLQMLDMGIALAHLELGAESLGYESQWVTKEPEKGAQAGWEYLISSAITF